MKIDKNSQQLADALTGQQARIIITTLQKFPYAMEKMESTPNRRCAVIVDEAHSSRSSSAASRRHRIDRGAGLSRQAGALIRSLGRRWLFRRA